MKKPKMITKAQSEAIAARLNLRDRNIWRLCCETGLRISDVLNLKAAYVSKIMYVTEKKTGKTKIIELSDSLLHDLQKNRKNDKFLDRAEWLFKSPRDAKKHLNRSTYHRRLKRACEGLKIECSAHSTRKLYAMEKFYETKNIFDVQKLLNHKYITTTADYLDINLSELIMMSMQQT